MPITITELAGLEARVNAKLAKHNMKLVLSAHFSGQRINDPRNVPPITLLEIETAINNLIDNRISDLVSLNDGDTFNLRCSASHINIPCGCAKWKSVAGSTQYEITAITIMRKATFVAQDPREFLV